MDLSIFLAKAIGLYYIIVAIGMIINSGRIKPLIIDLINNSALLFLSGFLALIIGILLVLTHNIWISDWRVIITIIGWLALIKGVVRVTCPQCGVVASKKIIQNNTAYYITSFVILLLGIYLGYIGFLVNPMY